ALSIEPCGTWSWRAASATSPPTSRWRTCRSSLAPTRRRRSPSSRTTSPSRRCIAGEASRRCARSPALALRWPTSSRSSSRPGSARCARSTARACRSTSRPSPRSRAWGRRRSRSSTSSSPCGRWRTWRLPQVARVLGQGDTKSSVKLAAGLQVDLRVVPTESFGAALCYFTGSKAHNVALRQLAIKRGYKLNEYGLFRGERRIAGRTEEEIYARLGLAYIPPELREDQGEI